MTERQQELERRLQDVTGQLGSSKKSAKKGELFAIKSSNMFIKIFLMFSFNFPLFLLFFLEDISKANPQARQTSSSSSSDSSSSTSSDSSSSDSSDSEAG